MKTHAQRAESTQATATTPKGAATGASNSAMQQSAKGAATEEPSLLEPWRGLAAGSEHKAAVTSLQQRLVDHDVGHLMGRTPTDGDFGKGTTKGVARFQQLNGLEPTGLLDATTREALGPRDGPVYGDFQGVKSAPSATLEAGKKTDIGKKLPAALDAHLATYERASQLTGVPVELLVMIHANESQFGTDKSATGGKEVGWGLDPDHVKTPWGSQQLAKVERVNELEKGSLGSWSRSNKGADQRLQNAVIAAEHLKRNAAYANIPIHGKMNQKDIAGAMGAWRGGPRVGKRAHASGKHHLFDPSIDETPHAYHPGGKSETASGRRSVKSGVKKGSLRGDVVLPLFEQEMARRKKGTPSES